MTERIRDTADELVLHDDTSTPSCASPDPAGYSAQATQASTSSPAASST